MSDAPSNADRHIVDLGAEFPRAELDTLVAWGASFLSSSDEDACVRSASLALEFAHLAWRNARARGRKLSSWQQRLIALALVASCVRARKMIEEGDNHVRH
jgi:hypothetical protein